jgi:DtxR family transcriptional regulator, Mn-dependent transcriptional regulator
MSESKAVTPALENYLEAIYILQKVKDPVRVLDIARYLDVKMPSVTYNVKKLAARGLVKYKIRSHVELTDDGGRIARNVLRTHEEFYKFFHDILGVSRPAAERDACRVEHVLSRETIDRLAQFSQWVSALPPDRAFAPAPPLLETDFLSDGVALSDIAVGEKFRVRGIHAPDELRRRLVEMGLSKGTEVEVVRVAPLGDPIEIKLKGFHLSLRNSEAAGIEVEPV